MYKHLIKVIQNTRDKTLKKRKQNHIVVEDFNTLLSVIDRTRAEIFRKHIRSEQFYQDNLTSWISIEHYIQQLKKTHPFQIYIEHSPT